MLATFKKAETRFRTNEIFCCKLKEASLIAFSRDSRCLVTCFRFFYHAREILKNDNLILIKRGRGNFVSIKSDASEFFLFEKANKNNCNETF